MPEIQPNQVALFKISKYFSIVGIGQVLTGEIVEGEINAGNLFQIEVKGVKATFRIDAVEFVDYPLRNKVEIGLIFEPVETDQKVDFKTSTGQELAIFNT